MTASPLTGRGAPGGADVVRLRPSTRPRGPQRGGVAAWLLILSCVATTPRAALCQDADPPPVADEIRRRVETVRAGGAVEIDGERLLAVQALPRFYESRGFERVWVPGSPAVVSLLAAIDDVVDDGLRPADYHRAVLEPALEPERAVDPGRAADLDLLLSDAFLVLASHLQHGRVNPESLEAEWLALRRLADPVPLLERAAHGEDPALLLDGARPRYARHAALRRAFAALRAVVAEGGWPHVPDGDPLGIGSEGERVAALRARLGAVGDLGEQAPEDTARFDEGLAEAVRRFQARHGLDPDGVVGRGTLAELEVPAATRLEQLRVNLERWRWLPDDLGRRYVEVNIAGFRADLVEGGAPTLRLRAIVGTEYTQTPSFSGLMRYLVLAPTWNVPAGIAAREEFPLIQADPGRIQAEGFTIIDRATGAPVSPDSVDWSAPASELSRRYRLRQEPGPRNALGRVKFAFPNRHDVYLHDTPGRSLFERAVRSFSHGCIRVERPLELAAALLADSVAWPVERIAALAAVGRETTIVLPEPVPVHLLYWTAWVDGDTGVLHYRRDLYRRDARVSAALAETPPALSDESAGR